jgi:hypothetical protein
MVCSVDKVAAVVDVPEVVAVVAVVASVDSSFSIADLKQVYFLIDFNK